MSRVLATELSRMSPPLVDRTPQIMQLAVNLDVHVVEVPVPLAADVCGEHRTEPILPEPYHLVADVDATFEKQILHVAQGGEPHVHQDHQPDYPSDELKRRNGLGGRARDLRGIAAS